jgi:hypothetical protein
MNIFIPDHQSPYSSPRVAYPLNIYPRVFEGWRDGYVVNVPGNTPSFGWIGSGMTPGICSSGSIANSIRPSDFWSPNNEEALDENRVFIGNELFLFAQPSHRVRERLCYDYPLVSPAIVL